MNEKTTQTKRQITIPEGMFCGHRCDDGCAYWRPNKRDFNGRQYCSWYDTYYYPRERGGCLSYK